MSSERGERELRRLTVAHQKPGCDYCDELFDKILTVARGVAFDDEDDDEAADTV